MSLSFQTSILRNAYRDIFRVMIRRGSGVQRTLKYVSWCKQSLKMTPRLDVETCPYLKAGFLVALEAEIN